MAPICPWVLVVELEYQKLPGEGQLPEGEDGACLPGPL